MRDDKQPRFYYIPLFLHMTKYAGDRCRHHFRVFIGQPFLPRYPPPLMLNTALIYYLGWHMSVKTCAPALTLHAGQLCAITRIKSPHMPLFSHFMLGDRCQHASHADKTTCAADAAGADTEGFASRYVKASSYTRYQH